jgi:hypothetical protein
MNHSLLDKPFFYFPYIARQWYNTCRVEDRIER